MARPRHLPLTVTGKRLYDWLADNHLTMPRLGRELGIDPSLMRRWCIGETTPSLPHAFAVQQRTGIPMEVWLRRETVADIQEREYLESELSRLSRALKDLGLDPTDS